MIYRHTFKLDMRGYQTEYIYIITNSHGVSLPLHKLRCYLKHIYNTTGLAFGFEYVTALYGLEKPIQPQDEIDDEEYYRNIQFPNS